MNRFIRKMAKLFRYGEQGFTLIELLIVIAVLGALAGVVAPNVSNMMGGANIAAANSELQSVKTASNAYLADYNAFPTSTALIFGTANTSDVDYLSAAPKATYSFDSNGIVTVVAGVTGGWSGVIFDISDQKWIRSPATTSGTADMDVP